MEKFGNIHHEDTLFLRIHVGTATEKNGNAYTMSTNAITQSPILHSEKTGKYFTLPWQEIISLAIEQGIDEISYGNPKEVKSCPQPQKH